MYHFNELRRKTKNNHCKYYKISNIYQPHLVSTVGHAYKDAAVGLERVNFQVSNYLPIISANNTGPLITSLNMANIITEFHCIN